MKKNWWKDFFEDLVGEIMFDTRPKDAPLEVAEVLKQSKIKKGAKVLDLACGVGRHSILFSQKGYDTTALDYSKSYLETAKRKAKSAKTKINFVHGDMKNLKSYFPKDHFGLVVSMFNSFGYFDSRNDDFKMLQEVHRVLVPGGKFIINTINGGGAKKKLRNPINMGREPIPKVYMIESAKFDLEKMSTESHWTIIDTRKAKTKVFKRTFSQNIYTNKELTALLKKAGFQIEKTWGVLGGGPFNAKTSWHQTILAVKK